MTINVEDQHDRVRNKGDDDEYNRLPGVQISMLVLVAASRRLRPGALCITQSTTTCIDCVRRPHAHI